MSSKESSIWEAAPHTIAKIDILESYLNAWFPIMGRSRPRQDLLYIDGFAGPGKYTNYSKGSPIAALTAAKSALTAASNAWVAGKINCAFIEADKKRYEHLINYIQPFKDQNKLEIRCQRATFSEGLLKLKGEFPNSFQSSSPLFVFIDPFGATGCPFQLVVEILESPCSEVLINFDADGIARILKAGESANSQENLEQIFGTNDWQQKLNLEADFNLLIRQSLLFYEECLRKIPKIRYVFSFEMRRNNNSINYFLIFASQNATGLEKMKEAMKKIDQIGTYCFMDSRVDQSDLFKNNSPEPHAERMFLEFQRKNVTYNDLRDFALNRTPFINPKSMLKNLEKRGLVNVVSNDTKRRKGTFNEEKIISIIFEGEK